MSNENINNPKFDAYLSPFSWRYGSTAMRHLWSESNKRLLWRKFWVALAEVQMEYGLVTPEQITDLQAHQNEIDFQAAFKIEAEIQHDLMAELRVFSGQCQVGGGIIHLGATSTDIEDNVDALRIRDSLDLILQSLKDVLQVLAEYIQKWADTALMAYTHLQPAEPSTLGYRLGLYGQDLIEDYSNLSLQRKNIRGKGFKGAVGTSAAYAELIGLESLSSFEEKLAQKLGLSFFPVTSQVYPRKQDYSIISALASLGASLSKFAFDIRILQSPLVGELSEGFLIKQVGSSAMPFKRNPIQAEKINSLARHLANLPRIAWDNAAQSLLERTLDDSANRRLMIPEAFLAADEILSTTRNILKNLKVDEHVISRNLTIYGPFAATERLLMALVKGGANRQEMHEVIRTAAMHSWDAIQRGKENPLLSLICGETRFREYLSESEIRLLMEASSYSGAASKRAHQLHKEILEKLD
jgi:adenylosuccinate lyase